MKKFKPTGPRVLIEPSVADSMVGTIIIPDVAIQKPTTGFVRALGSQPGYKWQLKVGDKVVLPQYGGYNINIDKTDYRVLLEEEIIGVINE